MSVESKLVLVAEEVAERVVTKEAIRQAIIAKGTNVPAGTALLDYPAKIGEIITGIPESIINPILDGINGEVVAGNYVARSDAISASKEAVRLAIIAKGIAVPVETELDDYPAKIAAITAPEQPIVFACDAVKTICANLWGSGGEITPTQAAAVTSAQFAETFRGLTTINSFSELYYFTGLTSIPANAFRDCTRLSGRCVIPSSVVTIGAYAFAGCKFTGALTFPASVTTINDHAFYQCTGFYSLVIPNTVTTLASGGYQFAGWYVGSTPIGTLTIGTGITAIPQYCFYTSLFTGTLTIPANVVTIGAYAFAGCKFTGTLTLQAGLTSIGFSAFSQVIGFTGNLVIPNSVTTWIGGGNQFQGCTGMTGTLTLGTGITTIPAYCFDGCKFTGTLTIPASVTIIGADAFQNCTGFTGTLTIPASVTTINDSAFYGCTGFTGNLVIPNTVTTLEGNGYQFGGCTGMTGTLTLGTGITTIPHDCFYGCKFTGTLTIPANVITIGNNAFKNITTFASITDESMTPPTLGTTVFSGAFYFYVYYLTVNNYKASTNWSAYSARIFGY